MMKHGNEKGVENGGADFKSVRRSVSSNDTCSPTSLHQKKKKKVSCSYSVGQLTPQN